MLERPAIIQNELERAEQLAPYECKHGLGCFCEKCSFKKRVAKTLDSMRKKRKENQGDFPPENKVKNIEESAPKLNAIGKPYGENYNPNYRSKPGPNISRLLKPMKGLPFVGDEPHDDPEASAERRKKEFAAADGDGASQEPATADDSPTTTPTGAAPAASAPGKPKLHAGVPVTGYGLFRILADSTEESRAGADRFSDSANSVDLEAYRNALADLYQRVMKKGRE